MGKQLPARGWEALANYQLHIKQTISLLRAFVLFICRVEKLLTETTSRDARILDRAQALGRGKTLHSTMVCGLPKPNLA